jgi:hypothetical protein
MRSATRGNGYDSLSLEQRAKAIARWGLSKKWRAEIRGDRLYAARRDCDYRRDITTGALLQAEINEHEGMFQIGGEYEATRSVRLAELRGIIRKLAKQSDAEPGRERTRDSQGGLYAPSLSSGYWQVPNEMFALPLPALVKLVHLCMMRHANGQPGRHVKALTQRMIAAECGISVKLVNKVLDYLREVGLIERTFLGSFKKRTTDEYRVPWPHRLDQTKLAAAIEKAGAVSSW